MQTTCNKNAKKIHETRFFNNERHFNRTAWLHYGGSMPAGRWWLPRIGIVAVCRWPSAGTAFSAWPWAKKYRPYLFKRRRCLNKYGRLCGVSFASWLRRNDCTDVQTVVFGSTREWCAMAPRMRVTCHQLMAATSVYMPVYCPMKQMVPLVRSVMTNMKGRSA